MKLRSESTLAEVADCLTDIGEAATLAQLQANAYLVVFPWVDTGAFGYDTARLFEGDESGELSAHEVRETVKARAAVRESLSREEAFLLPVNAKHPATERLSLGRARDNDLVVNSSSVSKLHAWLIKGGTTGWALRDNGSTNGTTHNDEPLAPQAEVSLSFGDTLGIGGVEALFCDARGVLELVAQRF
ncbi:MAG: FHA domain-containing protein [Planctomycetes bacterium]|nr:FHA domain-containing protein [Planctomycetota bacterium]